VRYLLFKFLGWNYGSIDVETGSVEIIWIRERAEGETVPFLLTTHAQMVHTYVTVDLRLAFKREVPVAFVNVNGALQENMGLTWLTNLNVKDTKIVKQQEYF